MDVVYKEHDRLSYIIDQIDDNSIPFMKQNSLHPDLLLVITQGKVQLLSKPGFALLETSPVEIIGQPVYRILPDLHLETLKGNEIMTTRIINGRGQEQQVDVAVTPIVYDGETGWQIIATNRAKPDIVGPSFTPFTDGWSDLESFIFNAADAISIQDLEYKIVKANRAFERLFGWPMQELLGKLPPMVPEFLQKESDALLKITKKGIDIPAYETIRLRKDGKQLYISMTISPVFDACSNVIAMVSITRDITQTKRLEQNFSKSLAELRRAEHRLREREKLSIIGTMAAGMAHEIRNPLTAIQGFVQLIGDQCKDDAVASRYVRIVLDEAKRANQILVDFLQLARPRPIVVRNASLFRCVEDVIISLEPKAHAKGVSLTLKSSLDKDYALAMLDESQMKQVLINIVQNAIEASDPGNCVEVGVNQTLEQHELYVEICDHGAGIKPEEMQRLGVPFFSTKDGGTGLGLSISYAIIEAHKGRVEVDSKVGQGTTFRICLPDLHKWEQTASHA